MMYFGHIAGILRYPKKELGMLREERYTTKTIFLTQISILAAIPAISMFIGVTQFGWSVAGENPVRLAASSAVSSAIMFYFAMWAAIAFIANAIFWMQKTYGGVVHLGCLLNVDNSHCDAPVSIGIVAAMACPLVQCIDWDGCDG